MIKLGKCAFILAPIFLIVSFFFNGVLHNTLLMSVSIVLATVFLIIAIAGKVLESRQNHDEEDLS